MKLYTFFRRGSHGLRGGTTKVDAVEAEMKKHNIPRVKSGTSEYEYSYKVSPTQTIVVNDRCGERGEPYAWLFEYTQADYR